MVEITCACGGKLRKADLPVDFYGIDFGVKRGEICNKCGAEYLDEKILQEVEADIKKRGIFGLEQKVQITKSGNSFVLRIPPEIARFVGVHYKNFVRMYPADKKRLEVEILS